MAQPHPQYPPPQPYHSPMGTPHGTPPVPQQGPYPPPPKRQRMSPTPQHPTYPNASSPQMTNGAIPNTGFNQQPYFAQSQQNGYPPQNGYSPGGPHGYGPGPPPNGYHQRPHLETPAPQTPTTSMGPPLRPPEEKPADLNDLQDVLHSAGIDIRSEEAALVQRNYDAQYGSQQNSFASQGTSFTSMGSISQPGYFDSSPYLSQNSVGDRASFYGAGPFNQAPKTVEQLQEEAKLARHQAIKDRVAALQYEMNDPFLLGKRLFAKISQAIKKHQIAFPSGLPIQNQPQLNTTPQHQQVRVSGGPNTVSLAEESSKITLPSNGALADISSLLSLAAKDRVRGLVEDSASLARGRRTTSHGIVPVDLVDLAIGKGASTETTIAVSPQTNSRKRSFSEANPLPTPISDNQDILAKTIAFPNLSAIKLAEEMESQSKYEVARAERREKRKANGLLTGEGIRASISGSSGPATPGTPGERAPDLPKKGVSKKEQKRQADAKASEAQQHAATSSSLSMALGNTGSLFGKKKVNWLKSSKPSNTDFVPPPKMNAAVQKATAAGGKKTPSETKFGGFREDKEGGEGIQIRDLMSIMELDSREKRTLSRGCDRLSKQSTKS